MNRLDNLVEDQTNVHVTNVQQTVISNISHMVATENIVTSRLEAGGLVGRSTTVPVGLTPIVSKQINYSDNGGSLVSPGIVSNQIYYSDNEGSLVSPGCWGIDKRQMNDVGDTDSDSLDIIDRDTPLVFECCTPDLSISENKAHLQEIIENRALNCKTFDKEIRHTDMFFQDTIYTYPKYKNDTKPKGKCSKKLKRKTELQNYLPQVFESVSAEMHLTQNAMSIGGNNAISIVDNKKLFKLDVFAPVFTPGNPNLRGSKCPSGS